jgi:hypothetical protein
MTVGVGGPLIRKHDCPNCGEQTHGSYAPEGSAHHLLCQTCFDAYYVEDDEAEYERRRRLRTKRD